MAFSTGLTDIIIYMRTGREEKEAERIEVALSDCMVQLRQESEASLLTAHYRTHHIALILLTCK